MPASARSLPAVRPSVRKLSKDLVALRRDLHRHPELSWQEKRTQAVILDRLRAWGLDDVRPIADTGATALVCGARPGRTLLWRADIDALPIQERNEVDYASTVPGVMHACGHDGHVAIALGLARLLHGARGGLAGNVRFVFQPAEEMVGGARRCVEEGVLEDPAVDAVLGLHVAADVPTGAIVLGPGPAFAAPTAISITIRGRGGHAAMPHQTVDAVVVAAQAVMALQTVVSRSTSPADTVVLTIGSIHGGERPNIIAEDVRMTGSIRTFDDKVLERTLKRVEEVIAGVAASMGAEYEFSHYTACPVVVNDAAVTALVEREARAFFSEQRVLRRPPSTGADDMAVFLERVPGCYFFLGGRPQQPARRFPHHHPGFDFDERALSLGLEFGLRLVESYLGASQRIPNG
jgi:amidohydrolase